VLGRAVFLSVKNPTKRSFFAPVGRKKIRPFGRRKHRTTVKTMETVTARKKKIGRPVKVVKKDIRTCVRFTKSEYLAIKGKATKAGMTTAAFLRQSAFQSVIRTRLSLEETQSVRQLVGMANNINQIAKRSHQESDFRTAVALQQIRRGLEDILRKLKR
jgi:hypothetical protein